MLPWADMFRAAVRVGVSPAEFWSLSLREWAWLVASEHIQPMHKEALRALLEAHPDG